MRPGARSEHPASVRERIRPLTLPFKRTEGEESHDAGPALQRQLRRQDRHTVSGHQRLDVGRECAVDGERARLPELRVSSGVQPARRAWLRQVLIRQAEEWSIELAAANLLDLRIPLRDEPLAVGAEFRLDGVMLARVEGLPHPRWFGAALSGNLCL